MVFDLDSTLLSTQERNHAIAHEFARAIGAPRDFMVVLEKIAVGDMGWNVVDDLRRRGFRHAPTLRRLRGFWAARFFSDDYLRHDRPLPGAVEFVRDAHAAGAGIFYLSGRDEPGMGRGTRASLAAHGFPMPSAASEAAVAAIAANGDPGPPPMDGAGSEATTRWPRRSRATWSPAAEASGRFQVGAGVTLRLKPRAAQDDLDFKRSVLDEIRAAGEMVAAFENEPANANLFREEFPDARVLFVDSVCSPDPPPLRAGIVKLKDFSRR